MTIKSLKAPQISRKLFGCILEYDGMGHYPGLELLNFVFCTDSDTLLPTSDSVSLKRVAMDFARRLVWDGSFDAVDADDSVLMDETASESIRHMMECLQLEIPNAAKTPSWERAHFFPYTKSLIHWDARTRKGKEKILMDRRYLRGGGAYAFHVLRKDHDHSRLERCRKGFESLYPETESPLEKVVSVLREAGTIGEPSPNLIEQESKLFNDSEEELYRDAVVRILEHHELSSVARIKALFNWTALWLVNIQQTRVRKFLGEENAGKIVCDCGAGHQQLRRESQRCLKDHQVKIMEAVEKVARDASATISKKQKGSIRSFFWASAATIKLTNSWKGRKHFVLGIDILETLVMAATENKSEISFDDFVDHWLYGKFHIVVGRAAAEKSGLLSVFDASIFEDNENQLAAQMSAAGLITTYSDATMMVSTGGVA